MLISSPKRDSPNAWAIGLRSPPAPKRPIWTSTNAHGSWASKRTPCGSFPPPAAAGSAASWTPRSNCPWRSRRGSSNARCVPSIPVSNQWPRARSAIRQRLRPGRQRTRTVSCPPSRCRPISTPALMRLGARRLRTGSLSMPPALILCPTFRSIPARFIPMRRHRARFGGSACRRPPFCRNGSTTIWQNSSASIPSSSAIATPFAPAYRRQRAKSSPIVSASSNAWMRCARTGIRFAPKRIARTPPTAPHAVAVSVSAACGTAAATPRCPIRRR